MLIPYHRAAAAALNRCAAALGLNGRAVLRSLIIGLDGGRIDDGCRRQGVGNVDGIECIQIGGGVNRGLDGLALTGEATMWMAVFADMGASLLVVGNGLRMLRPSA